MVVVVAIVVVAVAVAVVVGSSNGGGGGSGSGFCEVANFEVHEKTSQKTSILKLRSVKS